MLLRGVPCESTEGAPSIRPIIIDKDIIILLYYCVRPPMRGKQAREGGHKVDAVSPLNLRRQTEGLLEVFDHAHVVTKPPIYIHMKIITWIP